MYAKLIWSDADGKYMWSGIDGDSSNIKEPTNISEAVGIGNNNTFNPDLKIDSNGYPTIAYVNDMKHPCFIRYTGSEWVDVDGDGLTNKCVNSFTAEENSDISFDFDDSDNPHMVFTDGDSNDVTSRLYYTYWDGNDWQGKAYPTPGTNGSDDINTYFDFDNVFTDIRERRMYRPKIIVHNNTPYILVHKISEYGVFTGNFNYGALMLMKWNGSDWVDMNDHKPTASEFKDINLTFGGYEADIYVNRTYNSVACNAGNHAVMNNFDFQVDSNGDPYVVWKDPNSAYFKHWDGSEWVTMSGDNECSEADMYNLLPLDPPQGHRYGQGGSIFLKQEGANTIPYVALSDTEVKYNSNDTDIYLKKWDTNTNRWQGYKGNEVMILTDSDDDGEIEAMQDGQMIDVSNSMDYNGVGGYSHWPFLQLDSYNRAHVVWRENGSDGQILYNFWNKPISGGDGAGVGWISFNCENEAGMDDTCEQYYVKADINWPPKVTGMIDNLDDEDKCAGTVLQTYLDWIFSDSEGDNESAYRLVISDIPDPDASSENPLEPLFDTGVCVGYLNPNDPKCAIDIGVDHFYVNTDLISLDYGKTYYWWVEVWDSYGLGSGLTGPATFQIDEHEYPDVSFSYYLPDPSAEEKVRFDGEASYYDSLGNPYDCRDITYAGNCTWQWSSNPSDGIVYLNPYNDPSAPTDPDKASSTIASFPGRQLNQETTLEVTDLDGYTCSFSDTFNVKYKLPSWIEVK